MEMQLKGRKKPSELNEELLLVENSLLFTRLKLRYFPADYGAELDMLSKRRARIVAMLDGEPR